MKIQPMDPSQAMASLNTASERLTSAEAQRRLKEYGPNRVEPVRGKALPLRLLAELTTPFSLVLWVATLLAFVLERISLDQGMARLGYTVVVVILISGLFSFWQEYRSERALAALQRLLPQKVQVLRDAKGLEIPAERLVPGDVLLLEEGDNVPADCRLIEAVAVCVNNATLTGEAFPQPRDAESCAEEIPAHSRNLLLAGTSVGGGRPRQSCGVRHRHAHGIRRHRAPHPDRRGGRVAPAPADRPPEPAHRPASGLHRRTLLHDRLGDRNPDLGGFHLRGGHHHRDGPRGAPADPHPRPGAGRPAGCKAQGPGPTPARHRGAGGDHGHLYRQDGHPDPESDVCSGRFLRRG